MQLYSSKTPNNGVSTPKIYSGGQWTMPVGYRDIFHWTAAVVHNTQVIIIEEFPLLWL